MKLNLRGIPEKILNEGVFVHYRDKALVGDKLESLRDISGTKVIKGMKVVVKNILVTPKPNVRGFQKRLKLEGYEGEYNPKRFKKVR